MPAPAEPQPRIVVTGALVHRTPTRTVQEDLATDGPLIAASADGAAEPLVIDGRGASVVPLLVESVFAAPRPPAPDAFDLGPGRPATFAVVDGTVAPHRITRMLVVDPRALRAVVVDGRVVVRDGVATRRRGTGHAPDDPRLGAWTDPRRDMTQYLTADGRYSERRGTTRDAYTGSFWLDGDRITYLDDTGFWAFGQYHEGVLHHAGFVLHRA
ncbi:Atu4866 domain-containing protein [Promicromonospora sp. NPDC052451]|uniref:Atu4866 domain-containing protein n=1 Tax=Promicromonospora sp. NPDC052451 TaxID=3364407 RepID=UPI0037CC9A2A